MEVEVKTIVCATDLSDGSNKALPLAAFMADKFNARLVVVHVIDLPAVTPYGETMVDPQELRERVEKSAKAQLAEIMEKYPPISWDLKISIGYPAKEIQQVVEDTSAGMLLAATHMRSGLERILLGSVTRKLMHSIVVPFIIVPDSLPDEQPCLKSISSIMVASDFSPDAQRGIQWGLDLAEAIGANLTLATVIEPAQLNQIAHMDPHREYGVAEELQEDLTQKLKDFLPEDYRCANGELPQLVILAGDPHEELNKYAILNQVDMIIMGVHGRGFIENLLVGSTTDRLVRLGQFPVLAIRSYRGRRPENMPPQNSNQQ